MSSAMHVPCVNTGLGELSIVFESDWRTLTTCFQLGRGFLLSFFLGELLVIAGMTDADSSGGSAGVTDAGSRVVCGKCTCGDVACLGRVAGSSSAGADLTEAGESVVGGKCACEGVIVWVAVGLFVGAAPV